MWKVGADTIYGTFKTSVCGGHMTLRKASNSALVVHVGLCVVLVLWRMLS